MTDTSTYRRWARSIPLYAIFISVVSLMIVATSSSEIEAQMEGEKTVFTVEDLLNLKSISVNDITEDGRYLVCTTSRRMSRLGNDYTRYGDPTYMAPGGSEVFIMDGLTGEMTPLFDGEVQARGFTWSPDGMMLAFLLRKDDQYGLHTYDRQRGRVREVRVRSDKPLSARSSITWLPEGSGVLISLREEEWKDRARREFLTLTEGPIIVHDSSEPFLKWDAIDTTAALSVPAIVDFGRGEVTELLPEGNWGSIRLSEDGSFITFIENYPLETVYARTGGSEYELSMLDLQSLDRRVLIERSDERIRVTWNEEGDSYAYVEEGDIFLRSVMEEEGHNLTGEGRPYYDEPDTSRVRFSIMRFSPDGKSILCSSSKGYWLVDISTIEIERVYTFEGEEDERPRLSLTAWSPDGRYLYLTTTARDRWERGLLRYDLQDRRMEDLVRDGNLYRSWRLIEDGSAFYYSFSDGDMPNELYRVDSNFSNPVKLTDLNPWIADRKLTRSELVKYLDVDGEELYGILYYPADYEEGKQYPLVCEIYETFFGNGFHSNMNMITSAGYFGFRPSVNLVNGYPGEAWVKGITAGINKLIERGLVDPDRLGVHGTSYGGYATALLITQTPRFAAAINISGKVNMVSFYGDSPRLGIRNIQAPEWGQDRIGGSLWEYPERYLEHSAIMFADRIETPLMLITGDLDHNVPARQSMEMYYTMRRLGKEVVWVRYADGGHSPPNSLEEYRDYWNRILGWYAKHFEAEEEEK